MQLVNGGWTMEGNKGPNCYLNKNAHKINLLDQLGFYEEGKCC